MNFEGKDPFPYWVRDNYLEDASVLWEILADFPGPHYPWWVYDNVFEKKKAYDHDLPIAFNDHFNGSEFIIELEAITGIDGLIPDPHFRGGGYHMIEPGGFLDIHADFNIHPKLKLWRRLNVLIYITPDWKEEWGGHLELWNKDMTECKVKIPPLYNRMVCFEVSDTAYHGHPEPLKCPRGITRNSIALYYYTADRPEHEKSAPHSTLYQRRPCDPIDSVKEQLRIKRAQGRLE